MKLAKTTETTILHDHPIEGVRGISGVTHDGELVWFVDRYANDLVAIEPESGAIARRLGGLRVTSGLTFDGKHLWGLANTTLLEIEPETGEVLHSVDIPAGGSGIAWAEGSIWVGRFEQRDVMKIDPRTGDVLKTVHTDRLVTGVTWCEGALWLGAWESANEEQEQTTELRRVDVATGETVERIEVETGFLTSGVEVDRDGTFWCGDSNHGRICAVKRTGGAR